jgi:ubiquinone/menaquinone biosynthesis C-methylase UbiE
MSTDTLGAVLHRPAHYDLLVWLLMLGRDRALRRRIAKLARLREGDAVLDVGCGTGSLALEAKRQVGPAGTVEGIDPSPEMIARASMKARKRGLAIEFRNAASQSLPFPDGRFDAALSTMMLHHLSRSSRAQCAREMRRVVKPGGRVLVVEFGESAQPWGGILARFHRHGHVAAPDVTALLGEAGLEIVETGAVGIGDLHFTLAKVPA